MSNAKRLEGAAGNTVGRIAIVAARFNGFVVDQLLAGSLDGLIRHSVKEEDITVVRVPGAFELPLACAQLAATGKYEGIIALGAVIRGATAHFDFVAGEASRGILNTSLEYSIPIAFGLLTTENLEQALERADPAAGNKGFDMAVSVLEMIDLARQVKEIN